MGYFVHIDVLFPSTFRQVAADVASPESLNIERRYSCRAMLNFEPVAPQATGGISQINKSSGCPHVIVYMCARG